VTPSVIAAHAHTTADQHQAVSRAYGIPLRRAAPPTGSGRKAGRAAVDDVATHVVAFTATTVSLREAKLAGDRIYLLVLLADRVGEEEV
jgi:hypothetical protein